MDVSVVHWPTEAERLEQLRAARRPRLVIVEHGPPPANIDELEDWLRAPADEADLRVRLETLRDRATRHPTALVLADGVLHVGNRLVVFPPIQARLAEVLLDRIDTVVSREALTKQAWPDGAPDGRNVLDVHMAKLRRLLTGTGLDVRTVHRRGYLMHSGADDGAIAPDATEA
ncbi:MAG: transcriptional regulator [Actinomycetota bacterium]